MSASTRYRAERRLPAARAIASPAPRRSRSVIAGARGFRACAASAAPASRPGASGASCAPSPAPRLMAVNADEGEPGTFKDRHYLETDPHRFLEGMLIGAWAVEADGRLHLSARRVPADAARSCCARSPKLEAAGLARHTRDPPAARRRRLYLRRGIGDAGEHRGQARPAAPQAALPDARSACSAGRR